MGYLGYRHMPALRLHGTMGKGESPPALFSLFDRILNKNLREQGVVAEPAAGQSSLTAGTLTGTSTKAPDQGPYPRLTAGCFGAGIMLKVKGGEVFSVLLPHVTPQRWLRDS